MKIGILGGGQLSRMLALAGIPLGLDFSFYFPEQTHSIAKLGQIFQGTYDDDLHLKLFADEVDVITYENENIPLKTLEFLEKLKPIYPSKSALKPSQDRLLEKNLFNELNISTNRFFEINSHEDLLFLSQKLTYPFILKKRTHGYDGKGQIKVNQPSDLNALTEEQCVNTIAEEFVYFDREVSLIAAKNTKNELVFYDMCENIHKNSILFRTKNILDDPIFNVAKNYLEKIMSKLDYVGILTVEFFQIKNKLIANEMAPRVHNSGHWTIDACVTSQFENHLRSILGWPLGDVSSLTGAIMYNILGQMPEKENLLKIPGLCLHDYQKSPAIKRKLGHITLLNNKLNREISTIEKLLDVNP